MKRRHFLMGAAGLAATPAAAAMPAAAAAKKARPARSAQKGFDFIQVDVFTQMPLQGNPLACFPNATGLDPLQMQNIARELNHSETTFVLPAENGGDARVR